MSPRDVEPRIDWHAEHDPGASGMCAAHTWRSLGGDQGDPPAWSCSDANECVEKVKKSGRYWTPSTWDGPPPRGAWVGHKYGSNGHASLSLGDGRTQTTDPSNGQPSGVEPLDYCRRWGYTGSGDYTVWTDEYNGVRFAVGDEDDMPSADEVAKAVWDMEVEDPVAGDTTSMRQLLKRIRAETDADA